MDATTPAEERGERLSNAQHIARAGHQEGDVAGATEADRSRANDDKIGSPG